MQCHNCPKNGNPDEGCLACRCADYLDNDHKTVTPVDDVAKVSAHIVREPARVPFRGLPKRNVDDCLNVLDELKKCHHSSYKFIAKIVAVFISVGAAAPMLNAALDGMTLTEYAKSVGISKQASHQKWARLAGKAPVLNNVPNKRGKRDESHRTLD